MKQTASKAERKVDGKPKTPKFREPKPKRKRRW